MTNIQVEQLVYEAIASTTPDARVEQLAYEVLIAPEPITSPRTDYTPRRYRMRLFRRWW